MWAHTRAASARSQKCDLYVVRVLPTGMTDDRPPSPDSPRPATRCRTLATRGRACAACARSTRSASTASSSRRATRRPRPGASATRCAPCASSCATKTATSRAATRARTSAGAGARHALRAVRGERGDERASVVAWVVWERTSGRARVAPRPAVERPNAASSLSTGSRCVFGAARRTLSPQARFSISSQEFLPPFRRLLIGRLFQKSGVVPGVPLAVPLHRTKRGDVSGRTRSRHQDPRKRRRRALARPRAAHSHR